MTSTVTSSTLKRHIGAPSVASSRNPMAHEDSVFEAISTMTVHIPSRPYSRCSRVRYQEIRDIALHPSKRPCYSAPRDFGLHVSPSLGFDTSKLSCKHGLVWVKLNFCPCRIKNLVQSPLQSNLYGSIAGSDSGMTECFKSSEGGRNEPSRVPIQTNVSRPRGGHS